LLGGLCALPAAAADITFFNTGDPDGKIATASRSDSAGVFEIGRPTTSFSRAALQSPTRPSPA
jgi:hypothetical protein